MSWHLVSSWYWTSSFDQLTHVERNLEVDCIDVESALKAAGDPMNVWPVSLPSAVLLSTEPGDLLSQSSGCVPASGKMSE